MMMTNLGDTGFCFHVCHLYWIVI